VATCEASDKPVPASLGQKIREVGFHSIIYGLGNIAQSAVQFLLIPILTASLAPSELGVYTLVQMVSLVAGAIFYLGMTSALPRSYFDYSDEQGRKTAFTTAFCLLMIGALTQVILGYFGGERISLLVLHSGRYHREVAWALFGSALSFINQFFFSYLRFLRRSIFSIVLSLLSLIVSIGLSLALLAVDPHDLTAPFKGLALGQLLVAVVFLVGDRVRAFTFQLSRKEVGLLLAYGLPTVVSSVASLMMDWADRLIIERHLSLADVGVYSVAYKLSSAVNILLIVPFSQIFAPMMVEYRDHADIRFFFSKIFSYFLMLGGLIFCCTALTIHGLLPWVARGQDYTHAGGIVVLVMAGYILYGTVNILGAGLVYTRRIMLGTVIYIFFAVLKLGLNLWVIPHWGITGAAANTALIYALVPIALYWQAGKLFSFPFEARRLVRLALLCGFCAAYTLWLEPHWALPLAGRALALLGLLIVFVVFCVEPDERAFLHRALAGAKARTSSGAGGHD
jgi:O-antigen/teichoic acid export membrane protein